MEEYFYVTICQILYQFLRTADIIYIQKRRVLRSIIIGNFIMFVWLVATAIGIDSFLKGDWTIVVIYVVAGSFGKWLSFKIKL